MNRAEHLLGCAIAFRNADVRTDRLPRTFDDASEALSTMSDVLMHEAKESMKTPLDGPPDQPFMHPVDLDTDEPGIVDHKEKLHVMRADGTLPRVVYPKPGRRRRPPVATTNEELPPIVQKTAEEAKALAEKTARKALQKAESRAVKAEAKQLKAEEKKRAREAETPEQRRDRLDEARRRREEKREAMRQKEEEEPQNETAEKSSGSPNDAPSITEEEKAKPPKTAPKPVSEDLLVERDATTPLVKPTRKRVPGGKLTFHTHPVPHDRHLRALQYAEPSDELLPALLRGEASEAVRIVQGPPGTGKTRRLVRFLEDIADDMRVFVCAPTNVGAANLYERCVQQGFGDSVALCLPPERVPLGTAVQSNDPTRRIVCGTISSRSGPLLDKQMFDAVLVDEAAQVSEAWVWGLLRSEVKTLAMAGDVKQLPAVVSDSGLELCHERSLMQRLMELKYPNVERLTEQNRMAPELLSFPNEQFYSGTLTTGPHAPETGTITVCNLERSREEPDGTSHINRVEAEEAVRLAQEARASHGEVVILTPYASQARLILAKGSGIEVHTVDAFQGREAKAIVLSCVRDGTNGLGFWSDARRCTVALTRAREHLTLVMSNVESWDTGNAMAQLAASHY